MYLAESAEAEGAEVQHKKGEEIEVVFISLDSVSSEYENYRSTMPWHSVSHSNLWRLNIKDDLTNKYGVRTIPTLVVLDGETGNLITKNGKGEYSTYFKGQYSVPSSGCIIS